MVKLGRLALVCLLAAALARPADAGRGRGRRGKTWARRAVPTAWGTGRDVYGGYSSEGAGTRAQQGERAAMITRAAGTQRSFALPTRTRLGALRVTEDVELERRLELGELKRPAGDLPAGMTWTSARAVRDHRDLVANILDRFVTDRANSAYERLPGRRVMLAPLASRYQHAHRSHLDANGYVGPIALDPALAERFTQEISGEPIDLHYPGAQASWATVQRNYVVGIQHESATYYDTEDGAAARRGLAIREKRWHPIDDDGTVAAPTARGLFVKQRLDADEAHAFGVDLDDFTARREAHAELPRDARRREVRAAAAELAERYGLGAAAAAALVPVKRVENQRALIDLVVRGDGPVWQQQLHKIGFVAIDVYRTIDLRKAGRPRSRPRVQLEIELLPEGRDFYRQHPGELRALFAEIERAYGAALDPTPKYLHP